MTRGAAQPGPGEARIRVATYNVHQCVGRDGRRDVDRVAEVIRELDADIVGLQEVDSDPAGFRDSRQMDYLASMTGYEAVPGFTIRSSDRHYGNVLLSRYPIAAARQLNLSVDGHEPRGAIDAEVKVLGRRIRVVVTHFGLRLGERRRQAGCLLEAVRQVAAPLVLLGDLNEWVPGFGTGRHFARHFGACPAPASFPVGWPVLALDRIYCRPHRLLHTAWAHRSRLARQASDHLPVVGGLLIPEPDAPWAPRARSAARSRS